MGPAFRLHRLTRVREPLLAAAACRADTATMRRALVGLLLLAVACTPTSRPGPDPAPAPAPAPVAELPPVAADASPVTATLLGRRMGKPPLRFYHVRLDLVNRHDRPIWLVFPNYAEDALPASPVFSGEGSSHPPFGGKGYDGAGGQVVEVDMYGDPGFRAFLLRPRGRVMFDLYSFSAWKDVDGIEAWEVAALKVNDDLPLERWLPYTTLSDFKVRVAENTDWTNLDWDREESRERTDYRHEPVRTVNAEVLQRWQIPFRAENKP
jgi:hypothetical protein